MYRKMQRKKDAVSDITQKRRQMPPFCLLLQVFYFSEELIWKSTACAPLSSESKV